MTDDPRILIVDDEVGLADLYTVWLSDDYDVDTAYGGEEALEKIDSEVDIVFLDRRMPGTPGDEVLDEIRDRGFECRVAMVTAVGANFDVLDMPFDAYLSKPVTKDDLNEVIDRLDRRSAYDDAVQRYFSLVSRRASLEAEQQPEELRRNDEYIELVNEIERFEDDVDDLAEQLDDEDAAALFSDS